MQIVAVAIFVLSSVHLVLHVSNPLRHVHSGDIAGDALLIAEMKYPEG